MLYYYLGGIYMKNIPVKTLSSAAIAALLLTPVAPYVAEAATQKAVETPADGFYVANPDGTKSFFTIDDLFAEEYEDKILELLESGFENVYVVDNGQVVNLDASFDGADFTDYEDQIPHGQYEKLDGSSTEDVGEVAEEFKVLDISAINETSVEVTFPSDTADEEGLVGKEIVLTGGDQTLTATYSEKSLDKNGKAIFTLADGEKLEDAVEYTVSAEWAEIENATFVAKTAEAHVAEFVKVTEKVASNVKDDDTYDATKIAFAAKDQYGEDISLDKAEDLSVTGKVNGMPLSTTDGSEEIEVNGKTIDVDFALTEGDTLEFTIVDTKDNKKVAETTFTYEVAKVEKAVVSSIELTTTDNKTSAPSGETIEFEATAFDQFKSPDTAADLRWFVNGTEVTEDVNGSKYTLDVKTPGEYKVEVFSGDNTKVKAEKTVTIGAAELKTLELENEVEVEDVEVTATDERFNNEELVIGTLTPNEGAALVASNVKFHVTTSDNNLTKDDIQVTAEEAENADGEKVILVKATTTKAGSFQVTPYVGEEFTADKTVKAFVSTTVATKVNPEIATIEDITFDAKDLKSGTLVKKAIEFKNKHGEVLTADQVKNSISLTSSNTDVLKSEGIDIVQGSKDVEGEDVNKTYITFTSVAEAKGTTVLTIQAGAVVKTHTLNFVGATLTKIDAGSKVTGVVAGDDESKAKYNEINFLDQDGKKMAAQEATVEVTNAKGDPINNLVKLGTVTENDKGEITGFNVNEDAPTHAQILADNEELPQGTYNVTVTSTVEDAKGNDVDVKASFQVVVDAAREVKTVEVTSKTSTLTLEGTTTLTIVPKDQYDDIVTDAKENLEVTGDEFVEKTGEVTAIDKDGKEVTGTEKADLAKIVAYQVDVKGAKKGTGTVKVDVNDGEEVIATGSQSIKVDSVANVIEEVEVEAVEEVNNSGDGESEVTLKATGKDAAGNDVSIATEDLSWSVKSVKNDEGEVLTADAAGNLTDAKGNSAGKVNIDPATGVLTASKGITVEVEVQVTTANQKTATTTVKFNAEESKFAKDLALSTIQHGSSEAEKVEGDDALKITFDAEEETTSVDDITLTFTGVDQYEKVIKDVQDVQLSTGDRSVFTVAADALTISAVDAGTATLYAKAGNETLEIEVTVTEAAAKAINAGLEAEDKAN